MDVIINMRYIKNTLMEAIMKRMFKTALIILGSIVMIFSACDLNWDGEITVTGGTKLPNWITWIGYPPPYLDGIEIIEVNPPDSDDSIVRIRTYNSLVDALTVQCNCAKPCSHDYINPDEKEIEKLFEKFNLKYFETKNLIVVGIVGSPITMNFQVNNINKNGIINITETKKITFLPVEDVRVPVTIAIEIDNLFITPSSMSVSKRTVSK